jgi:L-threonylcarbamoyladenylate synthase
VNDQLGDQIKYILDGGECKVGLESTIIGFENDRAIIYRLGGLRVEDIEKEIGKVEIQLNSSSNPKAPGQLKSHYAPLKKVKLGNLPELLPQYSHLRVGVLAFQKGIEQVDPKNQIILSKSGNIEEAAQHLFAALRELDKKEIDVILAEFLPSEGLGKAINDRLRRASAD